MFGSRLRRTWQVIRPLRFRKGTPLFKYVRIHDVWMLRYDYTLRCAECGHEAKDKWQGGVKYRTTRFLRLKHWIVNKILFCVIDGKEYR